MKVSRSFACALFGLAMTAFSWTSPWAWPAWPALLLMQHVFQESFPDLPYSTRGAIIVFLIVVNSAFWGAIAFAATSLFVRMKRGA